MAFRLSQYVSIFCPNVLQFAEIVRLNNAVHLVNAKAPMELHATRAVGGFQTLEELQQVNGIGSGIYSQIAPYLFIIGELQTISPEPDTQPSESSEPTIPEEKTASDSESIPRLDINIATAEDFQKLPNVTPEQAEAIVRLRTQIQYFQNIYELLYADGMTDRLFLSIRDYLYVSFA